MQESLLKGGGGWKNVLESHVHYASKTEIGLIVVKSQIDFSQIVSTF